ncbi:MAG: CAP domain-containing protein [Dehalococcoidia bacterium]
MPNHLLAPAARINWRSADLVDTESGPSASWPLGSVGSCRFSGILFHQRIDIPRQRIDHAFRVSLRYRVEGATVGRATVTTSISRPSTAFPTGMASAGSNSRSETIEVAPGRFQTTSRPPYRGIRDHTWESMTFDFDVDTAWARESMIWLTLQPDVLLEGAACSAPTGTVRLTIDDVALHVFAADIPLPDAKPYPFPDLDIADETVRIETVYNQYRTLAGLDPVSYDHAAAAGARKHVDYMLRNNTGGHYELPELLGYTPEGDRAAREVNLSRGGMPATNLAHQLIEVPFHRLGLLSRADGASRLVLAFATGPRPANGSLPQRALALAPISDRTRRAQLAAEYRRGQPAPIIWPANGVIGVPTVLEIRSERPNPLTACGLPTTTENGYPITVEFPFTSGTSPLANLQVSLVEASGRPVPACVLDLQQGFPSPPGLYSPGGGEPFTRPGGIIIVPLSPLERTTVYTVRVAVTVEGQAGTWTSTFMTEGSLSALIPSALPQPVLRDRWVSPIPASGTAIAVFAGGSVHHAASGMRVLWAASTDGDFVTYVPGAPSVVNAAFLQRFPGGAIPADTVILVRVDDSR